LFEPDFRVTVMDEQCDRAKEVKVLPRGDQSDDAIVPLTLPPASIPLATAIRSTTLISSLGTIEQAGRIETYWKNVPERYAGTLRHLVAGVWVPIEVGLAHYQTVERLRFSEQDARLNGRRVAENVQNSHFATMVRALGSAVSLWSVLPKFPSFMGRLIQGGACAIYRVGPKDARIELHAIPIARFQYVRSAWAGMFEGTLGLVSRKVYARDLRQKGSLPNSATFELAWV
jgi:hypothetical protein